MMVLMMERVPASLRGELSRWMIEPKVGVFVGKLSAMVRDKLWELACAKAKDGGVVMLYSSTTEQGFSIRTYGSTSRSLIDFEGLSLICTPKPTGKVGKEDIEGQLSAVEG